MIKTIFDLKNMRLEHFELKMDFFHLNLNKANSHSIQNESSLELVWLALEFFVILFGVL